MSTARYASKTREPREKQYPANEYPAGSVPVETGWYDKEHALSKPDGHNKITVCRGGRRTVHKS